MPRILHEEGFRFSFYAADGREPPHIHVFKENGKAKWWLDPIREAHSRGLNPAQRSKIRQIVARRRALFLKKWTDFFSGRTA